MKNPMACIPPTENPLVTPTEKVTLPVDKAEMFQPEEVNLKAWTDLKMDNSYPLSKQASDNATILGKSKPIGDKDPPLGSFAVPMTSSNVVGTEFPVRKKKRTNGIL